MIDLSVARATSHLNVRAHPWLRTSCLQNSGDGWRLGRRACRVPSSDACVRGMYGKSRPHRTVWATLRCFNSLERAGCVKHVPIPTTASLSDARVHHMILSIGQACVRCLSFGCLRATAFLNVTRAHTFLACTDFNLGARTLFAFLKLMRAHPYTRTRRHTARGRESERGTRPVSPRAGSRSLPGATRRSRGATCYSRPRCNGRLYGAYARYARSLICFSNHLCGR